MPSPPLRSTIFAELVGDDVIVWRVSIASFHAFSSCFNLAVVAAHALVALCDVGGVGVSTLASAGFSAA